MGYYTTEDFVRDVVVADVPFRGSPCWIWIGRRDEDGYGWLPSRDNARDLAGPLAHRFAFVQYLGKPLFDGDVLDHLCRQRSCVNPLHLRKCSVRENTLAPGSQAPSAANHRKTHCKRGHLFDHENTKITTKGHRVCRTCQREHERAYQRRRRLNLRG